MQIELEELVFSNLFAKAVSRLSLLDAKHLAKSADTTLKRLAKSVVTSSYACDN
jgi:hypothetical protein